MASQPTPQEAAEALHNVDQRTEQAIGSLRGAPRWLDICFGLVIFLYGASTDFLPNAGWPGLVFAALVVGYVLLIRTRRGAALLGQSTRIHRQAISSTFARTARLTICVIWVGSLVAMLVLGSAHINTHVPYLSTIVSVVMAILLIVFGPQLRQGLVALAGNGHRAVSAHDGR